MYNFFTQNDIKIAVAAIVAKAGLPPVQEWTAADSKTVADALGIPNHPVLIDLIVSTVSEVEEMEDVNLDMVNTADLMLWPAGLSTSVIGLGSDDDVTDVEVEENTNGDEFWSEFDADEL